MKKLRGLGNRAYNVLFHTHTVSGIVISVALYIIFFAGAFALFRHEIKPWESPGHRQSYDPDFDYELAIQKVEEAYDLNWFEVTTIVLPHDSDPYLYLYGSTNLSDSTTERMAVGVSPHSYALSNQREPNTTVGDTIYYLHYFRQIPEAGLYISGFVGLFFAFASLTGLLIHWRNLLTRFYAFIKEGKWKTIWTNAHTVLGVIGLPFQLMYAVTGAFFGLLTVILLPSVLLLYEGNSSQVFNKIRPEGKVEIHADAPAAEHLSFTQLLAEVRALYPDMEVTRAALRNYGKEDALITWYVADYQGILSFGTLTMYMSDGRVMEEVSIRPEQKTYSVAVIDLLSKLHFAEFGGLWVKVAYFLLALLTCFMIISGVLIWRTARDTSQYTYQQRLFHHKVTKIYLAICLSLYPAFALLFLFNKVVPLDMAGRTTLVDQLFFGSWLLLIIVGSFWNSYAKQNQRYLFVAGLLSLLIPIANGLVTGDWFWAVYQRLPLVAAVDLFWFITGLLSLYISTMVIKKPFASNLPQPDVDAKATVARQQAPKPIVTKKGPAPAPDPQVAISQNSIKTD